ncbi:MAG TPA: hypothetical protein VJ725_14815 [Thermoanaerobaculia bacterium]|nr:hypothetical protein [Thermoanaerobaculia bacterium]
MNPPPAHELVRRLTEHRLLILAGDLDEKTDCARHLAYLLAQDLRKGTEKIQVRERCRSKDPQQIETAIQGEEPSILLLTEITPHQIVSYTPGKLRSLLRQNQSYAVITTDCSRADWGIEAHGPDAHLWCDLSWESYYGRELLIEFLNGQLADTELQLPEHLFPESSGEPLLIEGVELGAVIARLQTPSRVQYFAQWLLEKRGAVTRQEIEGELARLSGDEESVFSWYRKFESRNQLLVLGLTLFDGLPDNLLFAGLELLVETTWRLSDPLLPQFDYRDLSGFSPYFKPTESEGGFFRMECSSRERREQILKLAWSHQRRRLLASLPALTELIRLSAGSQAEPEPAVPLARAQAGNAAPEDRTGNGSEDRDLRLSENDTRQLHQALVDSLSLIGLLSIDVVKPYFLDLATDPSDTVQELAARALSAWRDQGYEAQLFSLLRSWWDAASNYEEDDPLLSRIARPGEDSRSAVKAAIALTLGYAARFDRPNRLAPELYEMLMALVEDQDPRVRKAVREKTLWLVIAWHFRQLEPLLRTKVLKSEDLIPAVAGGAAAACSMRPEESLAILDGWRATAKADRRQTSPLIRERLLATVALTYGYIHCEDGRELLTPQAIGARLRSMLADETHPYVRHYTFFAIEFQAVRNFELVALILQDLLSHISLHDRPAAVEVFVRTYLHQRQRLPGGDWKVEIGDKIYGVWIDSQRPLTEIEASLYSWIMDDSRPVAQQLAIDIFEAMAETALERAERQLRQLRRTRPRLVLPPVEETIRTPPTVHPIPLLGRMAVFLAAPRKKKVREILRPLVAEFLIVGKRSFAPRAVVNSEEARPSQTEKPRIRVEALLQRWTGVANDATKAIARHLRRALTIYRWRWEILSATFLTIGLLYVGGRFTYHYISTRLSSPETDEAQSGAPSAEDALPAAEEIPQESSR